MAATTITKRFDEEENSKNEESNQSQKMRPDIASLRMNSENGPEALPEAVQDRPVVTENVLIVTHPFWHFRVRDVI